MKLFIQDPTIENSVPLHEILLEICDEAQSGGGAFAFVTKGGVKLLLEDESFTSFANNGNFQMIVGVDEITNDKTINKLAEIQNEVSGLNVSAFLHNHSQSLFHPKFCWFKMESGGMLITGSGNLTVRGLRNNWEAFSVSHLDEEQISEVKETWDLWIEHNLERLKSLEDEEVLSRASKNVFKFKRKL